MKLFLALVLSFLFFVSNCVAQQTDATKSKNKIPLYAFGLRVHGSFGKQMALAGPEVGLNVFVIKKISAKCNAYVIENVTAYEENMVNYIHNLSVRLGLSFMKKNIFLCSCLVVLVLVEKLIMGN